MHNKKEFILVPIHSVGRRREIRDVGGKNVGFSITVDSQRENVGQSEVTLKEC